MLVGVHDDFGRRARPCISASQPSRPNGSSPVLSSTFARRRHSKDQAGTGPDTRLPPRKHPAVSAEPAVVRHHKPEPVQAQHAPAERPGIQAALPLPQAISIGLSPGREGRGAAEQPGVEQPLGQFGHHQEPSHHRCHFPWMMRLPFQPNSRTCLLLDHQTGPWITGLRCWDRDAEPLERRSWPSRPQRHRARWRFKRRVGVDIANPGSHDCFTYIFICPCAVIRTGPHKEFLTVSGTPRSA